MNAVVRRMQLFMHIGKRKGKVHLYSTTVAANVASWVPSSQIEP